MAERLVSPAVFTYEKDESFLPTGIGEIGAAVVGPTVKGPAFVPTIVSSTEQFINEFGKPDGKSYVPYLVQSYMENAGQLTVVRILGLYGYDHQNAYAVNVTETGSSDTRVVAVLHRSTANSDGDLSESSVSQVGESDEFYLTLSGSDVAESIYTCSLDPDSTKFIGKIFAHAPESSEPAYLYSTYENYLGGLTLASSSIAGESVRFNHSESAYAPAETPYIVSQLVAGNSKNLFKFKAIADGEYTNTEIKVSISEVRKPSEVAGSDYGTFTVLVRAVGDNDKVPTVLETYNNVNLNPDSATYIGKLIGDKYPQYDSSGKILFVGDYANKSKYVSVQVVDDIKNKSYSPSLIPWGFAAVEQPMLPATNTLPIADFVTTQDYAGEYNPKVYYGWDFDMTTSDNETYLKPLSIGNVVGNNVDFNLDNMTVHPSASGYGGNSFETDATPLSARRFSVPFQGGFDGSDPAIPKNMGSDINATNTAGFNVSSATATGGVAYMRAINLLENQDLYDINALFTPGLIKSLHSGVIVNALDMCETRGDVFYVFDNSPLTTTTLSTVTTNVSTVNSSYAATYYPWLRIEDIWRNNKLVWTPASTIVAGALSYNDKVGYEWYAPAGLNRGALQNAIDVYFPLKQSERDTLYEGRVNPIASFPDSGPVVWGQKTLQVDASALDRVNVRRLLIALKKYIASASKYLIFEQNTSVTRNKFLNIVNPYLESVQQRQGLYAFKVVMDETNNTPDIIDRNQLYGQIYIQPAKTAEFLIIDFNIMPTGATFDA